MIRVAARRLVTPSGVLEPGWLEVDGDRITRVVEGDPGTEECRRVPILNPGLVDIHVRSACTRRTTSASSGPTTGWCGQGLRTTDDAAPRRSAPA